MRRRYANVPGLAILTCLALCACGDRPAADPASAHDAALVLDGEGWVEFADRGDLADLVPGGERTVALWVRYTRPQYHAKILFKSTSDHEDVLARGWVAFVHQYSTSFGFWHRAAIPLDESGYTNAGTAGTRKIGDGAWHAVALVQRDTMVEAWVDGRLEFVENIARTISGLANDAPLLLGWSPTDQVRFAGEVDEFSLWSRALSRRELRRLRYRSPDPGAEGLVGYWPMDDGAGNEVADRTGGGWQGRGTALRWQPASRPLGPPFRERPTFFVLVAGLALGLLYAILRLYGRRLEGQKRKLELQVEARVEDLARTSAEKDRALAVVASQAERLKEINDAKARFFTNISHEFRTPLSLIVGPLSDTLNRPDAVIDPGVRAAMNTALRSGRRLGRLTGQLLDLARLEAREVPFSPRPVNLGELLDELAQSFAMAARRQDAGLQARIPDEPLFVSGDAHRLETVFANLLTNAIRFTPAGKQVFLDVTPKDTEVVIELRDEGPGVDMEARERIFERFYQTPTGARRGGSMGVGLALVRELVELHGGEVGVTSAAGQGAIFRVTLPRAEGEADAEATPIPVVGVRQPDPPPMQDLPEPARERARHASRDPELDDADQALPPLVLIVEDHPELRAFLRDHLSRQFRVAEAGDGRTALRLAGERTPDVVVSDVMMPDLDGLQLLSLLRDDPELSSIPVVLLTSRAELEHRIEGLERGADAYLAKPFEPRELTAQVHNLIEGRLRLRRSLMAEFAGPVAEEVESPADRDADARAALRGRLQRAVEERLGDPDFTVSDLAARVAMERTGLYKLMMAELGISPSDFMREIRLARAAALLAEGNTVAEVAYAVGYGSVSSFSRRFHDRFGRRPGGWAREVAPAAM